MISISRIVVMTLLPEKNIFQILYLGGQYFWKSEAFISERTQIKGGYYFFKIVHGILLIGHDCLLAAAASFRLYAFISVLTFLIQYAVLSIKPIPLGKPRPCSPKRGKQGRGFTIGIESKMQHFTTPSGPEKQGGAGLTKGRGFTKGIELIEYSHYQFIFRLVLTAFHHHHNKNTGFHDTSARFD